MKIFIAIPLVILCFSCTNSNVDPIDIKDIMTVTEYDSTQVNGEGADRDSTHPSLYFKEVFLDSANISLKKVLPFTESIFPDRFGAKHSLKLSMQGADTSTFRSWIYYDSVKTEAAFYNWMDAFGSRMKSIRVGESKNLQARSFFIFVGDTLMLYVENEKKVPFEKWLQYYSLTGRSDWKYVLYQARYGKVNWYTYTENELKSLE